MSAICFTILGEAASKANSREIVTLKKRDATTGQVKVRGAVIKSEKARNYERDALRQIPPVVRVMLTVPVRVTIRMFYASERPDLDESVVLDVLQARYKRQGEQRVLIQRGVYVNDRQVREKHIFHHIDRANPRAEIEVEPLVAQQVDLLAEAV